MKKTRLRIAIESLLFSLLITSGSGLIFIFLPITGYVSLIQTGYWAKVAIDVGLLALLLAGPFMYWMNYATQAQNKYQRQREQDRNQRFSGDIATMDDFAFIEAYCLHKNANDERRQSYEKEFLKRSSDARFKEIWSARPADLVAALP